MEPSSCRLAYLDDRFPTDRWLARGSSSYSHELGQSAHRTVLPAELQANVDAILQVFNQVYVCKSGRAFSSKLAEMQESSRGDCTPILALFDIAPDIRHDSPFSSRGRRQFSSTEDDGGEFSSLHRTLTFSSESEESYGLPLLSKIVSDLQIQEEGVLIVPIAITRTKTGMTPTFEEGPEKADSPQGSGKSSSRPSLASSTSSTSKQPAPGDPQLMLRCLEAGAVDVVLGQLDHTRVLSLNSHTYRAYKVAKGRQSSFLSMQRTRRQSWVGMDETKPYAYLREAMVEKLMNRICHPEALVEDAMQSELDINKIRQTEIATSVGRWDFNPHDYTEEELVYGASCMLHHAVEMRDLEKWRISFDELVGFIQAARSAYNSFVIYHNFRHAIDVLQSVFYFLLQIGALPPYPRRQKESESERSPIASLVKPFEALTLLIAAIGHDVGHPGVNNMFLVKLNAPLAQLYNDQSVLEAFHCAAYSQILRRHWRTAFEDRELRKLLISSILATDMGVHSNYMQQLYQLQTKIHESKTTDGWPPKDLETYRVLICGLLIKCADISNVARPWAVAERWTDLLQLEFAHQGEMERQVGMESCLFGGPPEIGNMLKLANGQIGFMSLFGLPLFEGMSNILPSMSFAADQISANKRVWLDRAEQERERERVQGLSRATEGTVSPRSQSPKVEDRGLEARLLGSQQGTSSPTFFQRSSLNQVKEGSALKESHHPSMGNIRSTDKGTPPISPGTNLPRMTDMAVITSTAPRRPSGVLADAPVQSTSSLQARRTSNTAPSSQLHLSGAYDGMTTTTEGSTPATSQRDGSSENERPKGQLSSPTSMDDQTPSASASNREAKGNFLSSAPNSVPSRVDRPPASAPAGFPHSAHRHEQRGSSGVDDCSKHTMSAIMTPASTKATSLLSESADETPRQNGDVLGLNSTSSNESKSNFRATILGHNSLGWRSAPSSASGNGANGHENGISKTLPKKRSRMRLAFWKKPSRSYESEEVSPS